MTSRFESKRRSVRGARRRAFARHGARIWSVAILCACGPKAPAPSVIVAAPASATPTPSVALFQAGTFSQLLAGDYRGIWSFGEIKSHGDFGIGTFEGINGELVVADGGYWQVHPDGHVTEVTDDQRTPYVEVVHFKPEARR